MPSALTTGAPAATAAEGRLASPGARQAYAAVQEALSAVPQLIGSGDGVGSNSWWSPGRGRPPAGRCWRTTPTAVGQKAGHLDPEQPPLPHRLAGLPPRRQRLLVRRARRRHRPQRRHRLGVHQPRPGRLDFYLERVVGDTYLRDGDWETITTCEEVIRVAGGADQRITVRTVHGPVMSDVVEGISDAGARA